MDDTIILAIKRNTITTIEEHFYKFDRDIRFTFDLFENTTPHFPDINIASDGLGIYKRDTFSGQYTNFESFVSWQDKISWARSQHWLTVYTQSALIKKLKLRLGSS